MQRCISTFKSRRQINILRYHTPVDKIIHAIANIVLCDGWRICKRVITEVLRQDALRLCCAVALSLPDSKFLELDI